MQTQLRIRQDNDEYMSYLEELAQWEAKQRQKDAQTAASGPSQNVTAPIRYISLSARVA